jgi:uncharacterized protein YdaT
MEHLEGFEELDQKIKDKAIEIAIQFITNEGMAREDALKEGVKQAKEWFTELEG